MWMEHFKDLHSNTKQCIFILFVLVEIHGLFLSKNFMNFRFFFFFFVFFISCLLKKKNFFFFFHRMMRQKRDGINYGWLQVVEKDMSILWYIRFSSPLFFCSLSQFTFEQIKKEKLSFYKNTTKTKNSIQFEETLQ